MSNSFQPNSISGFLKRVTGNYLADNALFKVDLKEEEWQKFSKWKRQNSVKSSLFMFKSLSRIHLKIKDIRIERVQDISEKEAKAEGAKKDRVIGIGKIGQKSYKEGFAILWNSINFSRGYGWFKNPWIWVIKFELIK